MLQENRRAHEFTGLADTPHWRVPEETIDRFRIGASRFGHRRGDHPRCNPVDPDAVFGEIGRQRRRELLYGAFRSGVGGRISIGDKGGD